MRSNYRKLALLGVVAAVGFMSKSTLAMSGCCAAPAEQAASSDQSTRAQHGAVAENVGDRASAKEPMQPIPSVLENYAKIEAALANDKLDGVPEAAQAISKLVAGDEMKMLPSEVATQADALASSKDLAASRATFKQLSASLITYLKREKVRTGRYFEAYCPMAKASWLQSDKAIKNPYYGKSMLTCGQITGAF